MQNNEAGEGAFSPVIPCNLSKYILGSKYATFPEKLWWQLHQRHNCILLSAFSQAWFFTCLAKPCFKFPSKNQGKTFQVRVLLFSENLNSENLHTGNIYQIVWYTPHTPPPPPPQLPSGSQNTTSGSFWKISYETSFSLFPLEVIVVSLNLFP